MRICPKCTHSTKESEKIVKDPKKNKHWLVTYCAKCAFNFDITEFVGEVKSPQQEMDAYDCPTYPPTFLPPPKRNWGF